MDDIQVLRKALDRAVADGNDAAARDIAQRIAQLQNQQPQQKDFGDVVPKITSRMQEMFGFAPPEEFVASALSAGRGVKDIIKGVKSMFGVEDQVAPGEQQIIDELEKEYPTSSMIGRVTGQALPFAALGPAAAGARSAGYQLAGRSAPALTRGQQIAGQAGLGASEGALITAGVQEDETAGDILSGAGAGGAIAGTVEAVLPGIGRLLSGLGKRAVLKSDGTMPEYAQEAVKRSGVDPEKAKEALASIKVRPGEEITGEDLERYLRFKQYNVPATRGDITGDFEQKAIEARLLESTQDELGAPMRSTRLQQSQAIVGLMDDTIKDLGVPDEAGENIKRALSDRRSNLKSQQRSLYKALAEESENVEKIPLDLNYALDKDLLEDLEAVNESGIKGLKRRLLKFGIGEEQEIADFIESGGKVTPLNLQNAERFRKTLNNIGSADPTMQAATIPLKKALDDEFDLALGALEEAGKGSNVGEIAQKARATTRQIKTEFSPQSVTGKLIDVKRDGVTPVVEASNVLDQVFRKGSRSKIEDLNRTITSLKRAGSKGQQALRDLQSAAVMRFIDESLGAATRNIDGERVLSGAQVQRAIDKFGEKELDVLFQDKPDIRKKLNDIRKMAEDITTPSGAVPKGSASVILDLTNKIAGLGISQKLPFVGPLLEGVSSLQQKSVRRSQAKEAGKAVPRYTKTELKQLAGIREAMPQMAALLGLSEINQEDEE